MKAQSNKHTSVWLTIFAVSALLVGCAEAKTVYVDDYRELRPFTTTVLSDTQPAPSSRPSADEQSRVSATGG
jgi:hypothetical protein